MNNASGGAFWQTPLDELERQLGASSNGLNSTEAAARLLRYGANTLILGKSIHFCSRF